MTNTTQTVSATTRTMAQHAQGKWVIRGGVILALVLGFIYLMILNTLATRGFALEGLKAERIQIQREMEEIDIALAIPTSMYAMQSYEVFQNMEMVKAESYLRVQEGELAYIPAS